MEFLKNIFKEQTPEEEILQGEIQRRIDAAVEAEVLKVIRLFKKNKKELNNKLNKEIDRITKKNDILCIKNNNLKTTNTRLLKKNNRLCIVISENELNKKKYNKLLWKYNNLSFQFRRLKNVLKYDPIINTPLEPVPPLSRQQESDFIACQRGKPAIRASFHFGLEQDTNTQEIQKIGHIITWQQRYVLNLEEAKKNSNYTDLTV